MHTFIAVPLPEEIREYAAALLESYMDNLGQKLLDNLKPVAKSNLHITLNFLGEKSPAEINGLKLKLGKLNFPEIQCTIGAMGAFPHVKMPRVLWLGVQEMEQFIRLFDEITVTCSLKKEGNFHPHITLARFKFPSREIGEKTGEFIEKNKTEARKFVACRVVLYESVSSPKGPEYRKLMEVKLGKK